MILELVADVSELDGEKSKKKKKRIDRQIEGYQYYIMLISASLTVSLVNACINTLERCPCSRTHRRNVGTGRAPQTSLSPGELQLNEK